MAETATDADNRSKRGGLYYEGFVVGSLTEHRYYRTVTQMDNMLFSNMTLNPQPLHIDRHFCETETEWGQPLMNSLFTLGLMIGMQVSDMTNGTTIANLRRHAGGQLIRQPGVRGRHPARHHRGDRQGADRSRAPMPASSNSTITLLQSGQQARCRMQAAGVHQEEAQGIAARSQCGAGSASRRLLPLGRVR